MNILEMIKIVLRDNLQLGSRVENFDRDTVLMGGIPEFDSMAVVAIITALEENLGIEFDDDDISADVFETIGTLMDLVEEKSC